MTPIRPLLHDFLGRCDLLVELRFLVLPGRMGRTLSYDLESMFQVSDVAKVGILTFWVEDMERSAYVHTKALWGKSPVCPKVAGSDREPPRQPSTESGIFFTHNIQTTLSNLL